MTQEERDLIARFIARVGGAASPPGFSGSVPTVPGALPPIDPEADRFIADQFASHPEARYRITQMAFVQEAALAEAQHRMQAMQAELEQTRQQAQAQAQPTQSRGFFSNLFGAGQAPRQGYAPGGGYPPQYAPSPQASYPPGYQQGMFQSGGSGFLGSALTTAAGVAGGVLAADALTSMFSPHGFGGGFGGGGFGGGMGGGWGGGNEVINETTVNNYGPQDGGAGADPWSSQPDQNFDPPTDQSFDNSADQGGGWDDNSGGGFDDTTSV